MQEERYESTVTLSTLSPVVLVLRTIYANGGSESDDPTAGDYYSGVDATCRLGGALYDRNVGVEKAADWEWCDIVILSARAGSEARLS